MNPVSHSVVVLNILVINYLNMMDCKIRSPSSETRATLISVTDTSVLYPGNIFLLSSPNWQDIC